MSPVDEPGGATGEPGTGEAHPGAEGLVPLEPRVLRLWRLRTAPAVVAAGLITGWVTGVTTGGFLGAAAGALAMAVAGGLSAWWTALVWRAWQFRVGDDALHLRRGVITRHESTIPYHRVQHIDLEAGPLERRMGLTSLVLRTAAASTDATVPGIDTAEAEALRGRILALVGTGDAL